MAEAYDKQRRGREGDGGGGGRGRGGAAPPRSPLRSPASSPRGETVLYVGNISTKTRAQDLFTAFSLYGRLQRARVHFPGRNYGIVEFADPRDANTARNDLDGQELFERRIIVKFASEHEMSQYNNNYSHDDRYNHGQQSHKTKLSVKNISTRTQERDFEDLFRQYGRVRKADLKGDSGFVEYYDPRDAHEARSKLDCQNIDGRRIRVEFETGCIMARYDDRHDQYDHYGRHGSNTKLYVRQISPHTRTEDLEKLFSKYGRLRNVDLKRNFGFVEFCDHRDAEDAMNDLDGRKIDGSRIIVEFARGVRRGPGGVHQYGRGPPPVPGYCYNCGMDGHWVRDCKAGDWRDRCYRCGEMGHKERDCKNSPKDLKRGRSYSRSPSPHHEKRQGRSYLRSPPPRHENRQGRSNSRSPPSRHQKRQGRSNSRSPPPRHEKHQGRSNSRSPPPRHEKRQGRSSSRSPSHHGSGRDYGRNPHRVTVGRGIAVMLVVKNCRQEAPDPGGAHHQGSKLRATAHIMVKPRGRDSDPEFGTQTEFSNASAERW